MRSWGWALIHAPTQTLVLRDTHTRGKSMGRHREKTAISKPERLPKKPSLLTIWSWTCGLENCEKVSSIVETTQSVVLCSDIPRRLIHRWYRKSKGRYLSVDPHYLRGSSDSWNTVKIETGPFWISVVNKAPSQWGLWEAGGSRRGGSYPCLLLLLRRLNQTHLEDCGHNKGKCDSRHLARALNTHNSFSQLSITPVQS